MPGAINVTIKDNTLPRMARFKVAMSREAPMVMANAIKNLLLDWFAKLDTERANKIGPRTHFWAQVRKSVFAPVPTSFGAKIGIGKVGMSQRYYGGPIEPKNCKFLAWGIRSESYGIRASKWKGGYSISKKQAGKLGGKQEGGRPWSDAAGPFFAFAKRVVQKGDPTVLPPDSAMESVASKALAKFLERFKRA